ncbi:MAG: DUF1538 domain-containing protein [Dysgonamonadaceae bacterium]
MLQIKEKFKEIFYAVIPIAVVVLLLHFTITPLEKDLLIKFIIGTIFVLIGMPLFLLGVDLSISPIGEKVSGSLLKNKSLWPIILGGIIIGFSVTIAEPDLHILAGQVKDITLGSINSNLMVILVSVGVGFMVALALVRVIKGIRLNILMTAIYLIIFALALFSDPEFLAVAFDASGSTTGSISVPFLLALSAGVSNLTRRKGNEQTDSFGMLGIASTGAIIAVLVQGLFNETKVSGNLPMDVVSDQNVFKMFFSQIPQVALEGLLTLLPVIIIFLIVNVFNLKESKRSIRNIMVGALYTYIGLVLFLAGFNGGFIDTSRQLGYQIASLEKDWILIIVGIILGVVIIPAEPSVRVLTKQIEDETAGAINSKTVLIALCVGVGIAVGLSIMRITIPSLQLWHIILAAMIIVIILSFIVPKIFVGIAYDSGGVAAGTLTATVVLPFAHGAAQYIPSANVVIDGFGVIAIVAITPLITIEIMGLMYKMSMKKQQRKSKKIKQGGIEV